MKFKQAIIKDESYNFEELSGKKCIDLLPNIDRRSGIDLDILKTWQHHLEQQGIPYYVAAITEIRWALFKEMRCHYTD